MIATRPIFTFRRPDRVFDSWLAKGWDYLDSFLLTYKTLIQTWNEVTSVLPRTVFYTYEYLTESEATQRKVFQAICRYWEVAFREDMLVFERPFGSDFVYSTERERGIYTALNPKGLFTTLINSRKIRSDIAPHGLITPAQTRSIERELMEPNLAIHSGRRETSSTARILILTAIDDHELKPLWDHAKMGGI